MSTMQTMTAALPQMPQLPKPPTAPTAPTMQTMTATGGAPVTAGSTTTQSATASSTAAPTSSTTTTPATPAAPQINIPNLDPSGFQNNFIQAALAPAIRAIEDQGAKARSGLGSAAAAAGAFGDARHGVVEAKQIDDQARQVGDLTATTMANAFDKAMGYRNTDMDRLLNIGLSNAQLQDTANGRNWQSGENAAGRAQGWEQFLMGLDQTEKDRALSAAGMANDFTLAGNQQQMNWLSQLMGFDNYMRGWDQQGLNTSYEDWMSERMWPITLIQALQGSGNLPGTTSSTTTSPNNSLANLLGSALGAFT